MKKSTKKVFKVSSAGEWVLVGLGNPEEQYVGTRHNVGRDFLAKITDTLPKKVRIIVPTVYMNDSGKAVKPVVKSMQAAKKLIVVHDDLDLPLGTVRVSFGRGSGGHKGVESIQTALRTKDFTRIRVGISGKGTKGRVKKTDVLGKFRSTDAQYVKKAHTDTKDALELLLTEGLEKTMTEINGR